MKNKKAVAIRFMIMLTIGVFVLLILMFMIPNLLGKGAAETSSFLDDRDNDDVADALDRCVCDIGDEDNDGCPPNPTEDQLKKTKEDC